MEKRSHFILAEKRTQAMILVGRRILAEKRTQALILVGRRILAMTNLLTNKENKAAKDLFLPLMCHSKPLNLS